MRTKAVTIINQVTSVIEGNLFKDIEEISYRKDDDIIIFKLDSILINAEKDFLLQDFSDLNLDVSIINDSCISCARLYIKV